MLANRKDRWVELGKLEHHVTTNSIRMDWPPESPGCPQVQDPSNDSWV